MIDSLSLNGVDLRTYGFAVRDVPGAWDAPAISGDGAVVPGRPGRLRPTVLTSAPRNIEIIGTLRGTSRASFLSSLHALKAALAAATLTVVRAEEPTLAYTARRLGAGLTATGPVFLQRAQAMTISLVCDDPYAYDTTDTALAFTTATAVPMGTAPTRRAVIRIVATAGGAGTAINPVITYRNSAGVAVATLGFTRTLAHATSDYLEIDLDRFSVVRSVSGVLTNDLAAQTSGDFFVPSPLDGVYGSAAWPTIEVSAGAGTLTYRRAWE